MLAYTDALSLTDPQCKFSTAGTTDSRAALRPALSGLFSAGMAAAVRPRTQPIVCVPKMSSTSTFSGAQRLGLFSANRRFRRLEGRCPAPSPEQSDDLAPASRCRAGFQQLRTHSAHPPV